jgi:hypothetical protein
MPIEVRIDAERNVVFARVSGEVGGDDLAAAGKALLENPDYRPTMNSLWDLRGMEFTGEVEPLRTLARFVTQPGVISEPIRAALLVGRPVDFGLARLYQTHAQDAPVKYQVFEDEREAWIWVGAEGSSSS